MTDRADAARGILAVRFFDELMDGLEQDAVNSAVAADFTDHGARQAHLAEVRAIRNLRSKLAVISQEDQARERKQAPA
jgi:hypothetical protein